MSTFSNIAIIYNPKSTGNSRQNAHELFLFLQERHFVVSLFPTKYAKHAEKLAKAFARKHEYPLVISASGDGGYNEVVNGVLASGNLQAVCAVLASGNANDHASVVVRKPLETLITRGKVSKIDVLKMTVNEQGKKPIIRYAHSYIGIGITPEVAEELNKKDLNVINEKLTISNAIKNHEAVTVRRNGSNMSYDSMVFANINKMAKLFNISEKPTLTDGFFEVVLTRNKSKIGLVSNILKQVLRGADKPKKYASYSFKLLRDTTMQFDGEVFEVAGEANILIESEHLGLNTLASHL